MVTQRFDKQTMAADSRQRVTMFVRVKSTGSIMKEGGREEAKLWRLGTRRKPVLIRGDAGMRVVKGLG